MGMLVLTRKAGQKIRIGDEIEITVLEIDGGRVRLGCTAPAATRVHREEIWQRIHAAAAAGFAAADRAGAAPTAAELRRRA